MTVFAHHMQDPGLILNPEAGRLQVQCQPGKFRKTLKMNNKKLKDRTHTRPAQGPGFNSQDSKNVKNGVINYTSHFHAFLLCL